jgi:hypothetical protein
MPHATWLVDGLDLELLELGECTPHVFLAWTGRLTSLTS